jgi:thiamine pyrophosphokinase
LKRFIIFANGNLNDLPAARAIIQPSDILIAADGGSRHCRALGIVPYLLIGDLDSTTPEDRAAFEAAGAQVIQHPTHKDQTDLELALQWAVERGPAEVIILGALGGRWDQTLANLLLPTLPAFQAMQVRLMDGVQEITTLRGPGTIHLTGAVGDTVSLIAVGGDVYGVTTAHLEYPLTNATLAFGSTLGISNSLMASEAAVSITSGILVCVTITQPIPSGS